MIETLKQRQLVCGAERFNLLSFARKVLDELSCNPDETLCNAFMASYAKALAETDQNPEEASSIFFTLYQKQATDYPEESQAFLQRAAILSLG